MRRPLHEVIAYNIKACRQAQNLTMKELADKCGLNWRSIQNAEVGYSGMRIQTLVLIANGLGVKPVYLLDSSAVDAHDAQFGSMKEAVGGGDGQPDHA